MPVLPGWNTVEGAERWGSIFTVLGLLALAALVLFDVLAFLYGRREKELATARDIAHAAQREKQRDAEQQQSQTTIGDLKKRLELAEKGQKDTQHQLETSAQQLAQSTSQIKSLQEKQTPRRLTSDQITRFATILARVPAPPGVRITSRLSDSESNNFARDIATAMKQAGWNRETNDVNQAVFTGDPIGVILVVRSEDDIPAVNVASYLQRAFKEIGIAAPGNINAQTPEHGVDIVVGRKPD